MNIERGVICVCDACQRRAAVLSIREDAQGLYGLLLLVMLDLRKRDTRCPQFSDLSIVSKERSDWSEDIVRQITSSFSSLTDSSTTVGSYIS